MKIVGREVLHKFVRSHADAESQIAAWIAEVEQAEWESPAPMKARYPNASILSGNRVVFNIKGNHYRLVTKLSYVSKTVLVLRAGTHAEYSKWNL